MFILFSHSSLCVYKGEGEGAGRRVVRGRFACVFRVGSDGVARDTRGLLKKHCGECCVRWGTVPLFWSDVSFSHYAA